MARSAGLIVLSGADVCQIDANGCVSAGIYRYNGAPCHGNNERCSVRVPGTEGFLTATEWDVTTYGEDYVQIGNTRYPWRYQRTTGPNAVRVNAYSTFSWHSDGSVTNGGWTICWAGAPTRPPPNLRRSDLGCSRRSDLGCSNQLASVGWCWCS